jgi:hypothetical protein
MAGYSGTPLAKKLGIGDGCRVVLVAAPDDFQAQLAPLPDGVIFSRQARTTADVILLFTSRRVELERRFAPLAQKLAVNGGLWVAWPKKASGVATDLTENVVREIGLAHRLVDNKVCAVDEVWSGLRFVVPVALRANWQKCD